MDKRYKCACLGTLARSLRSRRNLGLSRSCFRTFRQGRPLLTQKRLLEFEEYPSDVQGLAFSINQARVENRQLTRLPTQADISLDQSKAYQVAAAICALRRKGGEVPLGRKIGFTNRNIWPEYNIDASNWSYMYDRTVTDIPAQTPFSFTVDVSDMAGLEPKLEPEIIFGLGKAPRAGMTDRQLLDCIAWVSHGFEIVQSVFPGWKFTAADTTAAFALHGRLLIGRKIPVESLGSPDDVLHQLKSFTINLVLDDEVCDRGAGANVLGSPINALRHICEILEQDEGNPPLADGEVVTTGTLTRAWAIGDRSRWRTEVRGFGVPGLDCSFTTRTI